MATDARPPPDAPGDEAQFVPAAVIFAAATQRRAEAAAMQPPQQLTPPASQVCDVSSLPSSLEAPFSEEEENCELLTEKECRRDVDRK